MPVMAGAWYRVSDLTQEEQSQIPEVLNWITSHGYELADGCEYTIHGFSAFSGNRTFDRTWAQALSDFRTGKIQVLVTWKMNRLDRKLQATQMIRQVVDLGGRIEFTSQPHLNDLSTMGGRIALKVEEEIAYAESKGRSDNVKLKQRALSADNAISGKNCFGFNIVCRGHLDCPRKKCGHRKTLVINEAEADAIRSAVKRYMSGDSMLTVCRWLDSEGIRPRHLREWEPKSLSNIFHNPSLVGRRTSRGSRAVLARHDSILEQEEWDALQAEIEQRLRRKAIIGRQGTAMLTNVAVCTCGGPMYILRQTRPKKTYVYYRCHGPHRHPSQCRNMVPAEELETAMDMHMTTGAHGARPVMQLPAIRADRRQNEIAEVEDNIRALDLDDPEYDTKLSALRAERTALKDRAAAFSRPVPVETGLTVAEHWASLDTDGRRAFLLASKAVLLVGRKGREWWSRVQTEEWVMAWEPAPILA